MEGDHAALSPSESEGVGGSTSNRRARRSAKEFYSISRVVVLAPDLDDTLVPHVTSIQEAAPISVPDVSPVLDVATVPVVALADKQYQTITRGRDALYATPKKTTIGDLTGGKEVDATTKALSLECVSTKSFSQSSSSEEKRRIQNYKREPYEDSDLIESTSTRQDLKKRKLRVESDDDEDEILRPKPNMQRVLDNAFAEDLMESEGDSFLEGLHISAIEDESEDIHSVVNEISTQKVMVSHKAAG